VTLISIWNCPTCKIPVSTVHCAVCGERRIDPRELTIAGMLTQLLRVFSSIDGRLIRSFRTLLRSPGALTTSYLAGQRRVYVRPLSLFLVTNVFFFAVQSLSSSSIVAPPLESHLHEQDWSALASSLVAGQLEARQTSLDQLTPLYDQAAILNAKSLVILMVLPFTLLTALLFVRHKDPFVAHVVFSLHMYSFVLLLYCLCLLVIVVDGLLGGDGVISPVLDNILTASLIVAIGAYAYRSVGAVYGVSRAIRTIQALLLSVAVAAILIAYRFVIFLITLYSI
jgi:Protein of unknown function (DUF3667)